MFIVLVLIAAATFSFRGAKRAAYFKSGASAASAYSSAIEAYMADNGQTPPVLGSAAWPSAAAGPVDAMVVGPGSAPKPYMKSPPEGVSDGLVAIGSPTAEAKAVVTYRVTGRTYQLLVDLNPAGDPNQRCAVTNGSTLPAGYSRCG